MIIPIINIRILIMVIYNFVIVNNSLISSYKKQIIYIL